MLPGQESAEFCFETIIGEPRRVALLIGAGCSITAGIPLADTIKDKILEKHKNACANLQDKERSYNDVVGRISEAQFLELLLPYLKSAKVNLAHLCIAELVRQGVVDRVLTTNFDSLLVHACAMTGEIPAVYDCAAMPDLERVFESELPAIYYLHGQAYGLKMLNTKDELDDRASQVRNVVHRSILRRTLIVVGYSGTCDGVLEQLRDAHTNRSVFWVPFNEEDAKHALKAFSGKGTRARWVLERNNADSFFHKLLQTVGKFAPVIGHDAEQTTAHPTSQEKYRIGIVETRRPIWVPDSYFSSGPEQTEAAGGLNAITTESAQEQISSLVPKPQAAGWAVEDAGQHANTGL